MLGVELVGPSKVPVEGVLSLSVDSSRACPLVLEIAINRIIGS